MGVVHFLAWALEPVGGQGEVDQAPAVSVSVGGGLGLAADDGVVVLVHLALGEGVVELALHVWRARQEHQAGGGLVEPVHDEDRPPVLLGARAQAVLFVGAASGHA